VVFLDELTTGLGPAVAPGDLGAGARHPRIEARRSSSRPT
jgi:hypothetical protein